MTIHNPDNLPDTIINAAIQLMREENPNRSIVAITVRSTGEPESYGITPIFASVPFNRVRRVTGYLSTVSRFNSAKQAELKDRVTHGGDKP